LRIVNIILFPVTLAVGLILTAAGLAMFVPPAISSWLQFLGLMFPFLFVLNILLLIYWWVQLKLKLIIPLCFAIFNLIHVSKYVQYTANKSGLKTDFRLASFNTQLFGVMDGKDNREMVMNRILKESFDIVCLQEFYSKNDLKKILVDFRKAGKFKMYSFFRLQPDRPYGMAIFSNFEIVGSGKVGIGQNTGNMAVYADLLMGGDTVRLYNVHLQSIRFNRKDYEFIRQSDKNNEGRIAGSKNLLKRIREAYVKRGMQADSIAEHMKTCPYPIIVAGDFNDVPLSYAYHALGKDLLDAFRERGSGFERTYTGPFPNFRIDYILYGKRFICTDYKSFSDIPGDHKLISAAFNAPLKAD